MENQIDLDYLKDVYRRRKNIFFSAFYLITAVALLVAILLPPVYRSKVGIIIEEQQIPEKYVQSTITSYVEERIEMITKQVMSRSKLLDIINKYKLYRNSGLTEGQILAEVRKNIELETMTADVGRRNSVTIGFTLSFSGRNPEKLQAVANELAYLYLEEEHRSKEKMASVTTDFLQQELNQFKEHIAFLESEISRFKKEHVGELPQNYGGNIQSLDRLERQYMDIEREIRTLEERKLYLKSQIANVEPMTPIVLDGKNMMMNPAERLKRLRLELLSLQTMYSEKHPDIVKLKKEIGELEGQVGSQDDSAAKIKRLSDLTGRLAAMRGELGEKHPDVLKLRKEHDLLSKEVDRLMARETVSDFEEARPDNPVYINLMTQIVTLNSQIDGYRQELAQIQEEIGVYRARIESGPVVENEYNNLTRDLDTTRRKYNDLLGKLMQAKVAQGMESSQRGERFAISEPASFPDRPYKPNRKIILVFGVLLAVGVATGMTALAEVVDSSLKSTHELSSLTGIPVFSVLPLIRTAEEKRRKRNRKILIIVGCAIVLAAVVFIFHQFVMPMGVLWQKIGGRLVEIGLPLQSLLKTSI